MLYYNARLPLLQTFFDTHDRNPVFFLHSVYIYAAFFKKNGLPVGFSGSLCYNMMNVEA